MERVYRENPGDREAAIFYSLALLGTAPPTDKTYANQKKAGAILNTRPAEAARPSRRRPLPHPQLRLPAARGAGPPGRAQLLEDRGVVAPRAAHAVAHLRAPRPVGRLHPRQRGLRGRRPGARREDAARPRGLRRAPRPRLPGLCVPPAGARRAGARGGGAGARGHEVRQPQLRGRVRRGRGARALRAGARAMGGGGGPGAGGARDPVGEVPLRGGHHPARPRDRRRAHGRRRKGARRRGAAGRAASGGGDDEDSRTGPTRSRSSAARRRPGSRSPRAARTRRRRC